MSTLIDFPLQRRHPAAAPTEVTSAATTSAPADVPRAPLPRSTVGLLHQAQMTLAESWWETVPAQRYVLAYLAALRAAAAMLALRGRPHRGRARPTSAWVLLPKLAPELREWAMFFASASSTVAAVRAGIARPVNQRAADDLARQATQFIALVEGAMRTQEQAGGGPRRGDRAGR